MSLRQTWFWLAIVAGLAAFIFFAQRRLAPTPPASPLILPNLKPTAVTMIQVRPPGTNQLEIRAERTQTGWRLTEPLVYPAQAGRVEKLLAQLSHLTPAASISSAELRSRPKADEEYGFVSPQVCSIILHQGDYRAHLLVGAKTAPGDQLFLQVVGIDAAYVVDAELAQSIPRRPNEWRDTSLLDVKSLVFDRITVTNGSKVLELQRDHPDSLWRLTRPFQARADHARIEESLEMLSNLQVQDFVSDNANADLETYGLQPADLSIAFGHGTNTLALALFGKTNESGQVYAERWGLNTVVTVPKDLLLPWRVPVNDFRDPHLILLTDPVDAIEVHGDDRFSVHRTEAGSWQVTPQNFPADPALVQDFLSALTAIRITQFVKDVVVEPDLPAYGLAAPARTFRFLSAQGVPAGSTNRLITQVDFGLGTNHEDKVYARRTDETFVYAIPTNAFNQLPSASWQLRNRKIWDFTEEDVVRLTVRQEGRQRQLLRKGQNDWSFAPGSQGVINDLAVEQTVRGLAQLTAAAWVFRGEQSRPRFGFADNGRKVTLELKRGDQISIEFGGEAPSGFPYAGVTLAGEFWVFEFPWALFRDVVSYLSVP